jgi:hypothetical protein
MKVCVGRRVAVESPERFRVEVLFSPGASHNPFEVVPIKQDHTLPIQPRTPLHHGILPNYPGINRPQSKPHDVPSEIVPRTLPIHPWTPLWTPLVGACLQSPMESPKPHPAAKWSPFDAFRLSHSSTCAQWSQHLTCMCACVHAQALA